MRVEPLTGEEPHFLFGHTSAVISVAAARDGHWIAPARATTDRSTPGRCRAFRSRCCTRCPRSASGEAEIADQLRAARDPSSGTGWKIEIGPFPGWTVAPD